MSALFPVVIAIGVWVAPENAASRPAGAVDPLRPGLLVIRERDGTTRPIRSPRDWKQKRRQILDAMQEVMGTLPAPPARSVQSQILERTHENGITRLRLSLQVEPDDRVPAYLLLPDHMPRNEHRPAILALHQTGPLGKGSVVGLGDQPNMHYGLELARRGYIVMAPDYPSFGDYRYDLKTSRYASTTMKGIFNHMRCVDYLCSRPDVDAQRIGVIGHSLGGHNAIFAGAFDERLKVIVSSCGWTRFHTYFGGDLKGWASDYYMPRIRTMYAMDPDRLPFEFDEIIAALAPRAFFSNSPVHDANFDMLGVRAATRAVQPLYELLGAPDHLVVRHPECEHDFPDEIRQEAYRFIDSILKNDKAVDSRK